MRNYIKNSIVWGITFLITVIVSIIVIPEFFQIPINNDTILWILGMDLGFTIIFVGILKKKIHLGWMFLILGFYIVIISGGFLYGGIDYQGINMFDFNPYEKQRIYDLTESAINFFIVFAIFGIVMMGFGLLQFWNKLSFGWK